MTVDPKRVVCVLRIGATIPEVLAEELQSRSFVPIV